ncbi:uncharacterized protein LOC110615789 isoform X7 [Manihot esculenta]|uniref:uncharacterized protein LOC110615789 isoform X7 n=1 Tax=Manihot esculenta TaxID=3983 RepID=UPI000B5D4A13|nr:uncharacterized protein LOC110615789 isoform X7 [Manihot esculenta]
MQGDEARILLGFPPNSRPTLSQVKAAYRKKMSEAYTYLLSAGARWTHSTSATYTRVVRTGMPRAHGGRSNQALIRLPFFFIILGTVGLGGLNATRAYKKQKETYPSHNPFLP